MRDKIAGLTIAFLKNKMVDDFNSKSPIISYWNKNMLEPSHKKSDHEGLELASEMLLLAAELISETERIVI